MHVLKRHETIQVRFNRIVNKKRKACLKILQSLRDQGNLTASDSEIEALCEIIVLTATFWLNYAIISQKDLNEDVLARGVYQVISLVAPYLDSEQRQLLDELKQSYL